MARPEAPQERRQQVDADGGGRPEAHASRHHAPELLHALDARLDLVERARRVREEDLAGARRERPLADALEERLPERLLELPHLHADGGLRDAELTGGAREARVPGHRAQRAQVHELQVHGGQI